MRIFLVLLLGACLSFQCFVQLGVMGWYALNKEEITARFCENKSRPELRCEVICHLKKQLKQTENETEKDRKQETAPEWTTFILPERPVFPYHKAVSDDKFFVFTEQRREAGFVQELLRPPGTGFRHCS